MILAFDTAAAHCAAALLSGDTVLAARTEPMLKGQAERLLPLLEEVLAEAGHGWGDLTALGVGIGPGNFTGVRIAVSAARGLALALGIPAVGVSVLEAMALGVTGDRLACIDARRGEIYLQRFGATAHGPALTCLDAIAAAPGIRCIGDVAEAVAARTGGTIQAPAMPLAEAIARLASARFASPQPRPAPLYLRAADAALPSEAPPVILP